MAKRVSPSTIGAFVVGSVALLVAAILVVAGGNLFRHPKRYICMFQGDLSGLREGSAVKVKGVQIGTVEQILLALPPELGRVKQDVNGMRLPVILDLDERMVKARGGTGEAFGRAGFDAAIEKGMRAQLNVESLLTGMLYVDLSIFDSPAEFAIEPGTGPYLEIPTVPTSFEKIQRAAVDALARFEKIDFEGLTNSITNAANSFREFSSSPNVRATIDQMKGAAENLSKTLVSVRGAVDHVNSIVDPLVVSLRKSAAEADASMKSTREALADFRAVLDADSPLAVNLNQTLEQLTDTSRSLDQLTNYLQRNPSALIRGRYIPQKDR